MSVTTVKMIGIKKEVKMKKFVSSVAGMIALCSLFAGCSDDVTKGVLHPVAEGDIIQFSASANSEGTSRTSYGDVENGSYPVYWSNGDNIKVYCPQSQGTVHDAAYTISMDQASKQSTYTLSGDNSLKWGAQDNHDFYMFYPSNAIQSCENGIVTANLPREQNVTITKTTLNGVTTYLGTNMNYALMAGHTQVKRSSINKEAPVILPFSPITTALDIEIKAPQTGPGLTISSITVANPKDMVHDRVPLSGTFSYDINKLQPDNNQWAINSYSNPSYYVSVILDQPVKLESGTNQVLKVTAFLLPKVNKSLRVMVNTRESITDGATNILTKDITLTDNHFRKKTLVQLGNLVDKTTFSYETWMASLADNTYVSQISMPGTHDAACYAQDWSLGWSQTQKFDINTQLNKGVRVLDFRPAWNGSSFDVAHGVVTLNVSYDQILTNALLWLANHPTEFIIIELKNESRDSNFKGWQENMRKEITSIDPDYTIKEFNPTMTLGEARGKLLFMSRDDYDGGWYGCKISGWSDNNDSFEKTFYTEEHPQSAGGTGLIWISDFYAAKNAFGGNDDGTPPEEKNKDAAISKMLEKARLDTDPSVWYMTWLNVTGIDNDPVFNPGLSWGRPNKKNGAYNKYASDIINGFSKNGKYEKSGIVFLDWAGWDKSDRNIELYGSAILKSIIDNNFRAIPPRKQ